MKHTMNVWCGVLSKWIWIWSVSLHWCNFSLNGCNISILVCIAFLCCRRSRDSSKSLLMLNCDVNALHICESYFMTTDRVDDLHPVTNSCFACCCDGYKFFTHYISVLEPTQSHTLCWTFLLLVNSSCVFYYLYAFCVSACVVISQCIA